MRTSGALDLSCELSNESTRKMKLSLRLRSSHWEKVFLPALHRQQTDFRACSAQAHTGELMPCSAQVVFSTMLRRRTKSGQIPAKIDEELKEVDRKQTRKRRSNLAQRNLQRYVYIQILPDFLEEVCRQEKSENNFFVSCMGPARMVSLFFDDLTKVIKNIFWIVKRVS